MAIFAEIPADARVADDCLALIDALLDHFPDPDFQVRLWDGTARGNPRNPRFTLVLNHPAALRQLFESPTEGSLGEAYVNGDFDIEGDIEAAMKVGEELTSSHFGIGAKLHLAALLRKIPAAKHASHPAQLHGAVHSRSRDREAIGYHYNLPPEFYALFLDEQMLYSCAYFEHEDEDLETAQLRKLDYICRKLRLQPGERLLDIGCGWGALTVHAARRYGVEVQGITLSEPQAEVSRRRIQAAGLGDKCHIRIRDYRDLIERERYNKIVSVGMVEHVGEKKLPEYFSQAWRLLEPGGVFLNYGIGYSATYHRQGPSFCDQYVFPDGELEPLHVTVRAAEEAGFEVRDVESLREHYAMTLRHWVRRLESGKEEAIRLTNEITYRIWRLYMAGSAHAFGNGRLNVYGILLAKTDHGDSRLPLTRRDWY